MAPIDELVAGVVELVGEACSAAAGAVGEACSAAGEAVAGFVSENPRVVDAMIECCSDLANDASGGPRPAGQSRPGQEEAAGEAAKSLATLGDLL